MTKDPTQYERPSATVRRTVFAGSVVAAASGLIYSTFPVLLGSLAHQFHLGPRELGWLGSDYLGGGALGGLTSVLWIGRVRWRVMSAACLIILAAGIEAAYLIGPTTAAMAITFMVGVAAGTAYSIAIAAIAGTPVPQRGFSFLLAAELGSGTVLLWLLPALVIPHWGTGGAILLIASVLAISALACPWLPPSAPQYDERLVGPAMAPKGEIQASWTGVLALTMHIGLFTGLWVFLEKIGLNHAISAVGVGQLLMGAMALATGLALAASQLGGTGHPIKPLAAAMIAQCIGAVALTTGGETIASFVVGALLIVGPFALIVSCQLALIAMSDTTGRAAAFSGGAQLIGVAVGPALVGSLVADHGYQLAYGTFLAVTLTSLSMFVYISRRTALALPA